MIVNRENIYTGYKIAKHFGIIFDYTWISILQLIRSYGINMIAFFHFLIEVILKLSFFYFVYMILFIESVIKGLCFVLKQIVILQE